MEVLILGLFAAAYAWRQNDQAWKEISEEVPSMLDTLLDLAQCLRQPPETDLLKLLVERACHDPLSTVRFQAFRQLTFSPAFRQEALTAAEGRGLSRYRGAPRRSGQPGRRRRAGRRGIGDVMNLKKTPGKTPRWKD